MRIRWQADPSPGVQDDDPAEGEMEAPDLQTALATLQEQYDPAEWALMVAPVYIAPDEDDPDEPREG